MFLPLVLLAVASGVWGIPSVDTVIVVACICFYEALRLTPPTKPEENKHYIEIDQQSTLIRKLCNRQQKMAEDFFNMEDSVLRERRDRARSSFLQSKSTGSF